MSADTALAVLSDPHARTLADGPQLRTILLTDLCDSTTLVERLGDAPAAELFRAHDRLVLQLQQQWRGRLIDRSDGLLLLFERPIDGLGFALDYTRGLRELGQRNKVKLLARAGLHVGEVLTWRNSDEAVRVGAKPLEVEGLAKPMAARLMSMARPGQILMSAVAEPLAHRAARELGERGQNLLWKSYGRWRFKGVPDPQEIYEVGEPGIAPLRAPKNSPKSWRDIPLWRRPTALAAEVLLVLAVAIGIWFLTRPAPAIAFAQRDWVVIGDLRNLTGQTVLDDSLEQAFRISLEQSRYVNVLSDLKARDTLARMQRKPDTMIDRAVASEIALRDGARAVILPTVSEVGGRVRFSAEVIDPHTQTTVYAESADGHGAASTLDSIDAVTGTLRNKLGEAMAVIEKDSAPLPQVTTGNLDALRAYALGVKAFAKGRNGEAIRFYERALELDPKFALAHMGVYRTYVSSDDRAGALPHLRAAERLRVHLTPRDALYLDAHLASSGPVEPMLEKWQLLAKLYPDYFAGHYNSAWFGMLYANRYREGLAGATGAASPQNPLRTGGYVLRGSLYLALEDYRNAERDFRTANSYGKSAGASQISYYGARRQFATASSTLGKAVPSGTIRGNLEQDANRISLEMDQGRWREAEAAAAAAVAGADQVAPLFGRVRRAMALNIAAQTLPAEQLAPRLSAFLASEKQAIARTDDPERPHAVFAALFAGYLAERHGIAGIADDALAATDEVAAKLGYPLIDNLRLIVQAEQARRAGKPERAIELLDRAIDGYELLQAHVARMEAYADAGKHAAALQEADWLTGHRGRAYIEPNSHYILQGLNVADSNRAALRTAELHLALGRKDAARQSLRYFDSLWPADTLPAPMAQRRAALLKAL